MKSPNEPAESVNDLVIKQQEFLQALGTLPPEYQEWYSTLPSGTRQRVENRTTRLKHGMHSVAPLTCQGPEGCPFYQACPIPARPGEIEDLEMYPVGLQCVLETEMMAQRVADYTLHLNVQPSNPVEMSIVQELALIDLMKNRAMLVISHGDRDGQGRDLLMIDHTIMGYADDGDPITSRNTKLHPVVEFIDKLERRRERWLDKLMETRKAKADWAAKVGGRVADNQLSRSIQKISEALAVLQDRDQVLTLSNPELEARIETQMEISLDD